MFILTHFLFTSPLTDASNVFSHTSFVDAFELFIEKYKKSLQSDFVKVAFEAQALRTPSSLVLLRIFDEKLGQMCLTDFNDFRNEVN